MKQQNNEEIAIVNNDEEVIDNFLKFLDIEMLDHKTVHNIKDSLNEVLLELYKKSHRVPPGDTEENGKTNKETNNETTK